jgi:Pectate lyase superfamily protein
MMFQIGGKVLGARRRTCTETEAAQVETSAPDAGNTRSMMGEMSRKEKAGKPFELQWARAFVFVVTMSCSGTARTGGPDPAPVPDNNAMSAADASTPDGSSFTPDASFTPDGNYLTPDGGSVATGESNPDYSFPNDTGVVNVKTAHGAVGDGIADDTDAIQKAIVAALKINDRYTRPAMVYIPNGTYRITRTLETRDLSDQGFSFGWRAGTIVVGQSRAGVILKLADNLPAFAEGSNPLPMFKTGSENPDNAEGGGNQAFRHSIINLTFDTGNNPGAVGIDFLVSNRGALENVTIKSSGGVRGARGISMNRSWPGPCLLKHVTIDGFKEGITLLYHFQYGVTSEDLEMKNITGTGLYTLDNPIWIRRMTTDNVGGSAIVADGSNATVVVLDSTFKNGPASSPAILLRSASLVRNISTTGYGKAIDSETGNLTDVNGGAVEEYLTHGATSLNGGPGKTLNLPIEETPEFYSSDQNQWANVESYGSTVNNEADDDAPGIQAAIDSGKSIVYPTAYFTFAHRFTYGEPSVSSSGSKPLSQRQPVQHQTLASSLLVAQMQSPRWSTFG